MFQPRIARIARIPHMKGLETAHESHHILILLDDSTNETFNVVFTNLPT